MKATDELLKDHKMIRKVLSQFTPDNPKFPHAARTLHRLVLGHAWFEDEIFFPAVEKEPMLITRFMEELHQEHKDINHLLALIRDQKDMKSRKLESYCLQFKSLLETHFDKEEDALFPITEKILDSEGLNALAEEMRRRQEEIRKFAAI